MSLVFCAFTASAPDSTAKESTTKGLPWTTNLSKGIEEAKSSKRYVLADIYTDWCGWCKRLDATTFVDPDFVKYANANFVCVKCNAEDNGEGTKAAQQNGVNGYPTALVYDANGKVIGKIVGFKKAKDYQDTLEQIIKNQPLEL